MAAFTCYRRGDRRRHWGLLAIGLLLITVVPPFSYLPDPLGIVWTLRGGYVEDSRLPLANRFVLRENGTEQLRPYLNGLIGQTGLDPLHPEQALTGYSFGRVYAHAWGRVDVEVIFHYADGSSYRYPVPLSHDRAVGGLFYRGDWRYDGLARLRAEHRSLGDIPLVTEPAFTPPERLHTIATDWYTRYGQLGYAREPRLGWSPSGQAAYWLGLIADRTAALWMLPLAGEPQPVTDQATTAFWSAVDDTLFYLENRQQEQDSGRTISRATTLYRLPVGQQSQEWLTLPYSIRPSAGLSGIWYVSEETLWLLPYDSDTPQAIRPLGVPNQTPVYLSPDEEWLVTYCDMAAIAMSHSGLCLTTVADSEWRQVLPWAQGTAVDISWRPDGQRLALAHIDRPPPGEPTSGPTWLHLYDLANPHQPLPPPRRVQITPEQPGLVTISEPQWPHPMRIDPPVGVDILGWLPDGERLLLQTYPSGGRRLILVDGVTETAVDLSQPRWDALFALHPDGETLLLSNGRGSLWRSVLR